VLFRSRCLATTTQDHRLKQLEAQQQEILTQTTKFMALLTTNQQTPPATSDTTGHTHTPRHNTRKPSKKPMLLQLMQEK
jgi:hypothetical protein